jgi:hypothetical protein
MTIQEKNIKIAQEYGYKDIWEGVPGRFNGCLNGEWSRIPDYFSDLNAVHEFEKKLSHKQKEKYLDILSEEWRPDVYFTAASAVFATATERCEALGETLELW